MAPAHTTQEAAHDPLVNLGAVDNLWFVAAAWMALALVASLFSIRVGLSDGQRTEVIDGLSEGDKLIVGGGDAASSGQPQRRRGPF